jgi:hypothetical protein
MEHHFNIDEAKKYGIEEAILLHNIRYWCEKNKANGKHFYDNNYWTYNSVLAFAELFPYMSPNTIRRALEKLASLNVIGVGNYNSTPYEKTKWYCVFCPTELAILPNGDGIFANSNTDNKPNNKPNNKQASESVIEMFEDWLETFNMMFNRNHRPIKKVIASYNARIKEGYEQQELLDALENVKNNPYHIETKFTYITPEFMTRADKIEKYKTHNV